MANTLTPQDIVLELDKHIVGQGRALDLILTGRPVGAREALAMGLANRVVPKGAAPAVAGAHNTPPPRKIPV